jgi:nicotinamidase-related amidase
MTSFEGGRGAEGGPVMSWRDVIPPRDLEVYAAAGYGNPTTIGTRPAVLVIDVTYGFVGREPAPILESIATYPNSCGNDGWKAVSVIASILRAARTKGAPVYYTAGVTDHTVDHAGQWREKHPITLNQPDDAHEIVAEIAPQAGDIVIRKTKPSAFFGTPLVASLIDKGADTLIVLGCTTSGCVRATAVDSFSYGFPTVVVEDGVFDRGQLSHAVNLFDLEQKYAQVQDGDSVVSYLAGLAPVVAGEV